jgi:hypothetical protein
MNSNETLLESLKRHAAAGTTYEHTGDLELNSISIKALPSLKVSGSVSLNRLYELEKVGEHFQIGGSLCIKECLLLRNLPKRTLANTLIVNYATLLIDLGNIVTKCLHIEACNSLRRISEIQGAKEIIVRHCDALEEVFSRDFYTHDNVKFENCQNLKTLPTGFSVKRDLSVINCASFFQVPDYLFCGGTLDLTGCKALRRIGDTIWVGKDIVLENSGIVELPEDLYCEGSVEISGTKFSSLQAAFKENKIRCKGVDIGEISVFPMEVAWAQGILEIKDIGDRRSEIQRFGTERVMKATAIKFSAIENVLNSIDRIERNENILDLYFISIGGKRAYSIAVGDHLPDWNEASLAYVPCFQAFTEFRDYCEWGKN